MTLSLHVDIIMHFDDLSTREKVRWYTRMVQKSIHGSSVARRGKFGLGVSHPGLLPKAIKQGKVREAKSSTPRFPIQKAVMVLEGAATALLLSMMLWQRYERTFKRWWKNRLATPDTR